MVDKNSQYNQEKKMIINEMNIPDPRKKLDMKLEKRHYQILYYIYDKMLSWNCWTENERNYIIGEKKKWQQDEIKYNFYKFQNI